MSDSTQLEEQIAFHSEGISFLPEHQNSLRQWIAQTVEAEGGELGDINFIFCSDEYLHAMNVQYLQHDDYTDVITFPYAEEEGDPIDGDIFISIERIEENARQYGISTEKELHRVMIHGVLHLLGYEDEAPEEKAEMTEKEDLYLSKLSLV